MKDELNERISVPIVIDRSFFDAVEQRIGALRALILEERSKNYGVTLTQAQNFLDGKGRTDKSKIWELEKIREAAKFVYEISWENGISSVRTSLDEAIQTLEWEASKPRSIKISIGAYSPNRASIEVDGQRNELAIRASGPRTQLSALMESTKSLIINHSPQHKLLHQPWMPTFVGGVTFGSFFIALIVLSFEAGRYAVQTDPYIGVMRFFFTIALMFFGIFATISVSKRWGQTFPTIEFPYGQGRSAARWRVVVAMTVVYIILPIILSLIPSLVFKLSDNNQ
jgi:hypothetical protein